MIVSVARLRAFYPWLGVWLAVPVVAAAWWMGLPRDVGKCLAAAGSIVAVLGVLTLGRPVIRLGYRKWWRASNTFSGGTFPAPPDEIEEDRQRDLDAKALQISGPALVVSGTLLNGFSGFL